MMNLYHEPFEFIDHYLGFQTNFGGSLCEGFL